VALVDCFFEDGWVRGDSPQAVFADQALQFARRKHPAVKRIKPDTLAELVELQERIWARHRFNLSRLTDPSSCLSNARATRFRSHGDQENP
jgi:hypothetical protein